MTFQSRVAPWMTACFGPAISADRSERNHRFLEEAIELVQALGAKRSDAHTLVEYVFNRPSGEAAQEVGGVMVTLAALCLASDLDMHAAGEIELSRVWTKMVQIRAKQAAKPKGSPLPAGGSVGHVDRNNILQRLEDQIAGWPYLRRPGEIVEVRADLLTSAYQEIERLREPKGSAPPVAVLGYCQRCGAPGVSREKRPNGNDVCANGHTYPSAEAQPAVVAGELEGLTHNDLQQTAQEISDLIREGRGVQGTVYVALRDVRDRAVDAAMGRMAVPPLDPWVLIEFLRADEGNSVTLICDNPDFNGQPNAAVICNGGWTIWSDRRFTGDTVLQALEAAHAAMVESEASC